MLDIVDDLLTMRIRYMELPRAGGIVHLNRDLVVMCHIYGWALCGGWPLGHCGEWVSDPIHITQHGDIETGTVTTVVIETCEARLLPQMCTATADTPAKTMA